MSTTLYNQYIYKDGDWRLIGTSDVGSGITNVTVNGVTGTVSNRVASVTVDADDVGALSDDTTYAGSASVGGAANKAVSIPTGSVASASTSTAFTATVDGITSLYDGVCVWLKNGVVTSASGFTLNINGLGAKPVYQSMAAATAVTTTFNVNYTMLFIYNSTRVSGGCWDMVYGYYTNTTMAYGHSDYYFRAYAGQAIYRYKLLMQGADNRLYPIVTTNQEDSTQVAKTPTTIALRPWKVWYYNSTSTVGSGSAIGGQTILPAAYGTTAVYNFNGSTGTYMMIYLCGDYDKDTDMFTLWNNGSSPCTSYYKFVPAKTANISLSSYFTTGKYYLLVGGTYSTTNYFTVFAYNPFYYFDGTNLIPVSTKVAKDVQSSIPTKVSDLTNDSGFTTNTGTVTSVGITAGSGMSVSGSPVTGSGNITVGHSNSITAQTTQAIYPIKIDAQGHISAYGTAVTPITSAVRSMSWNSTSNELRQNLDGAMSTIVSLGNIQDGGDITSTATIANGDRIVINDESASKITNSSITFGSGTTTFLANNGTWQTPSGVVTSVNGSTGAVTVAVPTFTVSDNCLEISL